MSPQLGWLDDWSTKDNSGSINPDQGQPPSVFRNDCAGDLQAKLDRGNIPPEPQIRVSYEPDFSTGAPIAKDVCCVAAANTTVQRVRTSAAGGPAKKAVVPARRRSPGAARNKSKKAKTTTSRARKKAGKTSRKRGR